MRSEATAPFTNVERAVTFSKCASETADTIFTAMDGGAIVTEGSVCWKRSGNDGSNRLQRGAARLRLLRLSMHLSVCFSKRSIVTVATLSVAIVIRDESISVKFRVRAVGRIPDGSNHVVGTELAIVEQQYRSGSSNASGCWCLPRPSISSVNCTGLQLFKCSDASMLNFVAAKLLMNMRC